jgi:aspartyl-tRNA(Asn)/glutamyl-tRNA(Gln) amidotransferase subunit B
VPELPLERRSRFVRDLGLSEYDAGVLTDDRVVADYFEACLTAHNAPKSVANWIMNDVLRNVNERGISIADFEVPPARLAELARLTDEGRVNTNAARGILGKMAKTGKDAGAVVKEEGLEQVSDESALAPVIEQVIRDNPRAVQDYLGGKKQALGPLVGEVMRQTRGKSNPKLVSEMLRKRLDQQH